MIAYLAGPINGKLDSECVDWRDEIKRLLSAGGHGYLDPMSRDYRGVELDNVDEIVDGDKADIRKCDVVIVNATMGPSWGTAMEIMYSWMIGVPVVSFVGDSRVSPWLKYHTDVVKTIDQAVSQLTDL